MLRVKRLSDDLYEVSVIDPGSSIQPVRLKYEDVPTSLLCAIAELRLLGRSSSLGSDSCDVWDLSESQLAKFCIREGEA